MNSTIRFCSKCDNKYYHRIEKDTLNYYCRVCGNIEQNVSTDPLCVLDTQFKENSVNLDFIVNKYTKFDPTLPHISLKCPNDSCQTNTTDNITDAIYLRYDNARLKFLYICTTCDHKWKTE
jgi:aspartate carbamoyltransferase regulatory subunit